MSKRFRHANEFTATGYQFRNEKGYGCDSRAEELNSLPRTIPFDIIDGIKAPTNGNFTFGFVNAMVDSSGTQVASSAGTVDMDSPADNGQGVAGPGTTNHWVATNVSPYPSVALGTTFGASGSNAAHSFLGSYRTYSAQASGIVMGTSK